MTTPAWTSLELTGDTDMQEQDSSFQGRKLFKGRDTSWGIFYPTDHIIAIFDSFDTAKRAKEIMRSAGYSEEEADAVPSDYVKADIEKGIKDTTLLTRVRQQISKAMGTEAEYWEEDLRFAKQGAGFLAVRCASGSEANRVLRLLQPENPKKMRRYGRSSIEELV
jgi:hypothetical protein